MRLFVAVPVTGAFREAIAGTIAAFPASDPPWRWTTPPSWHVTLMFLGERNPDDVAPICSSLATVSASFSPFTISTGPLHGFPSLSRPRVLVVGVGEGAGALARLAARVQDALCDAIGAARDERPFHPHVTLARLRARIPRELIAEIERAPRPVRACQHVQSIGLIESHPGPSGARYAARKMFALGGGA